MTIEKVDWIGGLPISDYELLIPTLISGRSLRILANSWGEEGDVVSFQIYTSGSPRNVYIDIATLTRNVIASYPHGSPLIESESSVGAEPGLTLPMRKMQEKPRPGLGLYTVRLKMGSDEPGRFLVRAHGYRIASDTAWFYLEFPDSPPLDVASIPATEIDAIDEVP